MPVTTTIAGREIEPGFEIKHNGRWYVLGALHVEGKRLRVFAATDSRGRETAPISIDVMADYPRRIRHAAAGRPDTGRPTTLRLDGGARAALAAAGRPGESLADTVRRLLAVALDPALPAVLADARDEYDAGGEVECRDCDRDGRPCPDHEPYESRALDARRLLAALGAGEAE